jgi:alkanesulfonate monooxygenase SsuD/methylene tetrahydromethanopterin reductase-like flavin-dependent oxidoreductase (luciferase family)
MNLGIYFDLRNPPPWRQDPARLYGATLELIEEAERLGVHSVWLTEHHLFEDDYLPQPLTYCAAIAARTKRVRIGTAILIAPFYPAVAIAEQAAVVDLISSGRFELGLGAGYRVPEFALYGADLKTRYEETDARVRDIRRIWTEGKITPAPAQARVPIWLGYQGPKGAYRAGLLGEGLLVINAASLAPYREGLIAGGHDAASARMCGTVNVWVSDDPDRDWPLVASRLSYQFDSYRRYAIEGTDAPSPPPPVDPARMRASEKAAMGGQPFFYGTPEHVAAKIKGFCAGLPVETIILWASIAGMPEEAVARNIQLLATELAPRLA